MEPPDFDDEKGMTLWLRKQLNLFWSSEQMEDFRFPHEEAHPVGVLHLRDGFADDDAAAAAVNLDYAPLVARLRSGRYSQKLIEWVANYIQSGGFASRKSHFQRRAESHVRLAAEDVPHIKRLWRIHYGVKRDERGRLHHRAIRFAALVHSLGDDEKIIEKIANYLGRSRRARQRVA